MYVGVGLHKSTLSVEPRETLFKNAPTYTFSCHEELENLGFGACVKYDYNTLFLRTR